MRKNPFNKMMVSTVFLIILISSLTFAADKGIVILQGIVMELDVKKNRIVVNEQSIHLDQNTIIHNEKGLPVHGDRLKSKIWVYVEGVTDKAHKKVVAKKIYLLPKYIDEKEKHLYPFIK